MCSLRGSPCASAPVQIDRSPAAALSSEVSCHTSAVRQRKRKQAQVVVEPGAVIYISRSTAASL